MNKFCSSKVEQLNDCIPFGTPAERLTVSVSPSFNF